MIVYNWEAYYNVKSNNAVSWIYFFNVTNIFDLNLPTGCVRLRAFSILASNVNINVL
jgi:hypothetical protein